MSTLAKLINIIAFSTLFLMQASVQPIEKPHGIRRALQTYAGQLSTGAYPTLKPVWQLGGAQSDAI
ncbi:hypothetical protein [Rhizobium sp. SG2393]|uniref:hypothetical protein n=1 Tax=Rhizobium sp. SG2393 TaxID=3276279 RepID=UPI00366AF05B